MGNYGKSSLLQHKVSIIFKMNPCDGSFSTYDCAMISPLLCAQQTQGCTLAKSQPGIYTTGSMMTQLLDSAAVHSQLYSRNSRFQKTVLH